VEFLGFGADFAQKCGFVEKYGALGVIKGGYPQG